MSDRAKRPLNQSAVRAADDQLYSDHADDPRPNPLYDADGNRQPLDANNPDQADLRKEWTDDYKANGGGMEPEDNSAAPPDQAVLPCGQKPRVDPLIIGEPVELDTSAIESVDDEPAGEPDSPEAAPQEKAPEPADAPAEADDTAPPAGTVAPGPAGSAPSKSSYAATPPGNSGNEAAPLDSGSPDDGEDPDGGTDQP
jgi:hypothetical protein